MADEGWIKLHRKITKSLVWTDPQRLKLWLLILIKARHVPGTVPFNGREQHLNSGQLVTGRVALRDEMNAGVRPSLKVNSSFIYRALKDFESLGMLNIKSNPQFSVITVLNWNEYQQSEQLTNSSRTANEQLTNTNKNVKNEKNVPTTTEERAAAGFYEQNFGVLSPFVIQKIEDWVGDFQEVGASEPEANQILVKGMEIAISRNKRSFGYVEGILRDWESKHLNSVASIEGEEAKFKAAKQARGSAKPQATYDSSRTISDDDLPF
ncbi:MAG: DnaD domain protein [Lactobacillus sp.]|jgi:DnaD/phage-associated family protein|nr:DnaD domain protein [Lactobacillus sp.]MCI2032086.1 DnaD domain protein [Lactobacillus sp.]